VLQGGPCVVASASEFMERREKHEERRQGCGAQERKRIVTQPAVGKREKRNWGERPGHRLQGNGLEKDFRGGLAIFNQSAMGGSHAKTQKRQRSGIRRKGGG